MLSVLTQSVMNASFGIYFPRFTGTIYEILSARLSHMEIVRGASTTESRYGTSQNSQGGVSPKHDAFSRAFNRLTPKTMKALNDLVVQIAIALALEDGKKLRVDTSVVETDIHYPTDNTLLWDVVRVVTRLTERLIETVEVPVTGFHNRTRSARSRMLEIQRMTTRQRGEQQTKKYREIIDTTAEVVESARSVLDQTREALGKTLPADLALHELRKEIGAFCALGDRVIDQTRRRVLRGEQVLTEEKFIPFLNRTPT